MSTPTLFAIPADSLSWAGLLQSLQHLSDFHFIGHTTDARHAVEQAGRLRPDLILMALHVAGELTAPLADQLRAVSPASKIVVVADDVGRDDELAALAQSRVHGHLLCRTLSPQYLEWSLRLIADADMRMASGPVLDAFVDGSEWLRTLNGGVRLSPRQREVLALLAAGLTQKAIAARLAIAPTTVGTYLDRMRETLGVHTRADLIATARRRGFIPAADVAARQ